MSVPNPPKNMPKTARFCRSDPSRFSKLKTSQATSDSFSSIFRACRPPELSALAGRSVWKQSLKMCSTGIGFSENLQENPIKLIGKHRWFPVDFPFNQSLDTSFQLRHDFAEMLDDAWLNGHPLKMTSDPDLASKIERLEEFLDVCEARIVLGNLCFPGWMRIILGITCVLKQQKWSQHLSAYENICVWLGLCGRPFTRDFNHA